jgi:uncharacterized protein
VDLRKRLAALDRSTTNNKTNSEGADPKPGKPGYSEDALISKLHLVARETKAGTVWVRDYVDDLAFPEEPLPDLREILSGAHLANPSLEEIFFLDTETTGLAGGTGTLAFLIGCSWFYEGVFHTRQYFLPGPGLEGAILQDIQTLSAGFSVVMTFNGGSFDLPLLRTRALMNRIPDPVGHLVSWDLLMAGRRLWGKMLENCKQQTLEQNVCGVTRTSADIEGALIPQTWFDFVATGETADLEKVLYHNHRDMVGMGVLFGKIIDQVSLLQDEGENDEKLSWQECWALGKICEKRKNQPAAEFWVLQAVAAKEVPCIVANQKMSLFQDSIRILKRSGKWNIVDKVIGLALGNGVKEPWLYREAAILREHRLVDLSLALDYALLADDQHRVSRLERKLSAGR